MYPNICLVGDIIVDVTLKTKETPLKLRLGGIIHAARGLWALGIPYSIAYIAPAYLDEEILKQSKELGCQDIVKIGNITGSPYVFLIENVKETGNQGYEFLLRHNVVIEYHDESIEEVFNNYEDIFMISGNYDINRFLKDFKGNVHMDIANNVSDFEYFTEFHHKLKTIFLSTSSKLFSDYFKGSFLDFVEQFRNFGETIVVKENRGGSRAYNFEGEVISIPAQTQPIVHSVGVGDVYDATYVSHYKELGMVDSLFLGSWIATEYAKTTFPDDFQRDVQRIKNSDIKDLINLGGIFLPWEKRKDIHIYIAAPDFSFIDVTAIDTIFENLTYHNFTPHRPIKENGQMEHDASKVRKQELFSADMKLIEQCSILLAVLLYDDPGTLIEIGLAAAKGMPTIIYDPYDKASNCMLTELPTLVSNDLDIVLSEVFIQSSKLIKYE